MRFGIRWAAMPIVLLTVGCSPKTEGPSVTTTSEGQKSEAPAGVTAAKQDVALVRFVNADPSSKLDVLAGKNTFFSGVDYKMVTPYKESERGFVQFKVQPPGASKELASGRRELFPGRHYTVLAFPQKKGDVVLTMSDNLGKIDPGIVRIRLINAMLDAQDLELFLAGEPKPLLHGIEAGRTAAFVDMEPGSVDIRTSKGKPSPGFGGIKVEANRLYTFVTVGTSKAPELVQIVDRVEDMVEP